MKKKKHKHLLVLNNVADGMFQPIYVFVCLRCQKDIGYKANAIRAMLLGKTKYKRHFKTNTWL